MKTRFLLHTGNIKNFRRAIVSVNKIFDKFHDKPLRIIMNHRSNILIPGNRIFILEYNESKDLYFLGIEFGELLKTQHYQSKGILNNQPMKHWTNYLSGAGSILKYGNVQDYIKNEIAMLQNEIYYLEQTWLNNEGLLEGIALSPGMWSDTEVKEAKEKMYKESETKETIL